MSTEPKFANRYCVFPVDRCLDEWWNHCCYGSRVGNVMRYTIRLQTFLYKHICCMWPGTRVVRDIDVSVVRLAGRSHSRLQHSWTWNQSRWRVYVLFICIYVYLTIVTGSGSAAARFNVSVCNWSFHRLFSTVWRPSSCLFPRFFFSLWGSLRAMQCVFCSLSIPAELVTSSAAMLHHTTGWLIILSY